MIDLLVLRYNKLSDNEYLITHKNGSIIGYAQKMIDGTYGVLFNEPTGLFSERVMLELSFIIKELNTLNNF